MSVFQFNITVFCLILSWLPGRVSAEILPENYQMVRDCRDEWLVYSPEYKNYVPYIQSLHDSEPSVSILLDLIRDRHFQFLLKAEEDAYIFINGSLHYELTAGNWIAISCDSLYRQFEQSRLMVTIFGLRGAGGISARMAIPKITEGRESAESVILSLVSLKPKTSDVYRDFSIIAWLTILSAGMLVFLTSPSFAFKLTNPATFFSRDYRSELYNHYRPYSPVIVTAVAVLSLIAGFLLMTTDRFIMRLLPDVLTVTSWNALGPVLFGYGKVVLFCFGLFYLKYFVISVTLGILNLSEISHIHYIKAVQSSLLIYSIISLILLTVALQYPNHIGSLGPWVMWAFVAYYGFRTLVLYVLLSTPGRFINLYLISYLCVVELMPLIIGIKFAT